MHSLPWCWSEVTARRRGQIQDGAKLASYFSWFYHQNRCLSNLGQNSANVYHIFIDLWNWQVVNLDVTVHAVVDTSIASAPKVRRHWLCLGGLHRYLNSQWLLNNLIKGIIPAFHLILSKILVYGNTGTHATPVLYFNYLSSLINSAKCPWQSHPHPDPLLMTKPKVFAVEAKNVATAPTAYPWFII